MDEALDARVTLSNGCIWTVVAYVIIRIVTGFIPLIGIIPMLNDIISVYFASIFGIVAALNAKKQ